MHDFIAKYQDPLSGTLSGFDRLVFRGTLWKNQLTGMSGYLWAHGLGAKDFGAHAEDISKRLKQASLAPGACGRTSRPLLELRQAGQATNRPTDCRRTEPCRRSDLRAHGGGTLPKLCHPA